MYYFDKLCFEGCGIFGMVYVGAIKYLEEQDLISNVNFFSGTSSGAIITTMLALGYTSSEIYDVLEKTDWNKLYDYNIGCFNFLSGFGLYKGDKLHKLYKQIIKNKTNSEFTTFKELYLKTGKKLYICAVNANKQRSEYFSVDTHPFMEIHLALRLSTSFPFIFKSLKFRGDYYVDGGVIDNYPIEIFNDTSTALGFNLVTDHKKDLQIKNIIDFTKHMISSMSNAQNMLELNPYKNQTVCIFNNNDSLLTSVMDIGDMKDDLTNYYHLGYNTTVKFFDEYKEPHHDCNVSASLQKQESLEEEN